MRVILVNPFDPLPGEAIREGRYAAFARALAAAGHQVTWLSSDFSHTLKKARDRQAIADACRQAGFQAELLSAPPYQRNVSLARLRSHRVLAGLVRRHLDAVEPFPDVVLVSAPPPSLAAAAAEVAARRGAKLVLDIQDLWPEAFRILLPPGLRWASVPAGWPMSRHMRQAIRHADLGLGVAEAYRLHFAARARPATPSLTLHLGVDIAQFDRHAEAPPALPPQARALADGRWILAGGMIGAALDWDFLFALAGRLQGRCPQVRILVVGTGPLEPAVRERAAARRLGNVHVLGYHPYPVYCALAARADFGLNHVRRDSLAHFPNRVFDYFAADLPVLNTIGGELADLLDAHAAGFTTTSRDAEETAAYVQRTLADRPPPDQRPVPRLRRGQWVEQFDRPAIARRLVTALEGLASDREISP